MMQEKNYLGLLVTIVTVLSAANQIACKGPICYDCTRIPFPRDCDHVRQCTDNQACVTRLLISDSGHQYFETGCRSNHRCLSKRDVNTFTYDEMSDVAGDISVCQECCHGDFCNIAGCGAGTLPERSERGPVCFNCNQQVYPDTCEIVTVCDEGEECFLTQYIAPGTDDHLYRTSCKPKSFCEALHQPSPSFVGRRDNSVCMGCCKDDYCNRNCSVLEQTKFNHQTHTPTPQETTPTTTRVITPPTTRVTTPTTTRVTTPTTIGTTTQSSTLQTSPTTRQTTTESMHTTTSVPNKSLCEAMGYAYFNGMDICFNIHRDQMLTWQQSRGQCQSEGGDLIVYHSIAEELFFEAITKNLDKTDIRYWVGASDIQSESKWVWLDGTPVGHDFFHPNEPNSYLFREDCGAVTWYIYDQRAVMNDENCDVKSHFICEINLKKYAITMPSKTTPCRNSDYVYSPETGICFKVYNKTPKTHDQAQAVCQSEDADLLILRDRNVESYFQHQSFHDSSGYNRYWLGANKMSNGSFAWLNGQLLDSTLQWTPLEPNNYHGNENCLTFYYNYNTFGINDDNCGYPYYFICQEKCPDTSYTYVPALGLCFKIYEDNSTWSDARGICRGENADLLELTSEIKLSYLQFYIDSVSHGAGLERYWIGANDPDHDMTFNWLISRDAIKKSFWHEGEPSITPANEYCAGIWRFAKDGDIKMNNADCNTHFGGFICEYIR